MARQKRTKKEEQELQVKQEQAVFEVEDDTDTEETAVLEFAEEPSETPEDISDLIAKIRLKADLDIFEDCARPLFLAGDQPRMVISRDNTHITTVSYSLNQDWNWVQRTMGGGYYQIKCRSTVLNQFVKSQPQTLAGPPKEYFGDTRVETKEAPQAQIQTQPQQNPATEMLMIMQQAQREAREEQKAIDARNREEARIREERAQDELKSNNQMFLTMMTTMVTALQPKPDNSNVEIEKLRMEMQRQQAEMAMKLRESDNKRIEDLITSLTSKKEDKGPSVLELMKMKDDAEAKGFNRAMAINELAEERAEELTAQRLAEKDEDEKPSTMETFMKGVVPLLASQGSGTPVLTPQAPRQAIRVPARAVAPAPRPAPVQRNPIPSHAPQARKPDVVVAPKPVPAQSSRLTPQTSPTPKGPLMNGDKKKFIQDTASEIIGSKFLMGEHDPVIAANETLEKLKPSGINANDLYSQFTLQDMIKTAGELGMPATIKPYLEGFYAHIATKAGTNARKPAETGEAGVAVQ